MVKTEINKRLRSLVLILKNNEDICPKSTDEATIAKQTHSFEKQLNEITNKLKQYV